MWRHYFVAGFRNIKRNIGTTLISLVGLSIALTSFILTTLWVRNELSFDNYHKDAKDIYLTEIKYSFNKDVNPVNPYALGFLLERNPNVKSVARLTTGKSVVDISGNKFNLKSLAFVDTTWFDIFNYSVEFGSLKSFARNPYTLVLTSAKAKQFFGNTNAVGKSLLLDTIPYQVIAVVEDNPTNSSFQFDVLISNVSQNLKNKKERDASYWNNASYRTFVKLNPRTKINPFLNKISENIQKETENNIAAVVLQPLNELHFDTNAFDPAFKRGSHLAVFVFSILSIVLLLIGSINYVNFTIAKINVRTKEVSVRKIIGGSKTQIFLQFLTEAFIMCLLALVLSLVIIFFALPLFYALTDIDFNFTWHSAGLWLVSIATLIFATILNGIFPALTITYFKPLNFLQGYTFLKYRNVFFRKILVGFQFVVAIVFIVGTVIIYKQMKLAQSATTQYNRSQVLTFSVPSTFWKANSVETINAFCRFLKSEILKNNVINKVALMSSSPEGSMNTTGAAGYYWSEYDSTLQFPVSRLYVTSDAMDIFHFKMEDGRWFKNDVDDKSNFVLNETAVKSLGLSNPIGKIFAKSNGDTGRIIGVIKDYAFQPLYEKIGAMAFCNSDDDPRTEFYVQIVAGKIPQAMSYLTKVYKKYFSDAAFDYMFMDQSFQNLYKNDLKMSKLLILLSSVVVVISFLGLFGIVAFISEQRIKEIGIRKVFGASVLRIVWLLSSSFLRIIVVSIFLALPIAWWLSQKWLNNFVYKISLGWDIFFFVGIIVMCLGALVMSFQVFRSAISNPVKSLRSE